jgi:hypothetical protein
MAGGELVAIVAGIVIVLVAALVVVSIFFSEMNRE